MFMKLARIFKCWSLLSSDHSKKQALILAYNISGTPKCEHLEIRTSCFCQDTSCCPNAIEMCILRISLLISGHLSNQDTLSRSQKCLYLGVPLTGITECLQHQKFRRTYVGRTVYIGTTLVIIDFKLLLQGFCNLPLVMCCSCVQVDQVIQEASLLQPPASQGIEQGKCRDKFHCRVVVMSWSKCLASCYVLKGKLMCHVIVIWLSCDHLDNIPFQGGSCMCRPWGPKVKASCYVLKGKLMCHVIVIWQSCDHHNSNISMASLPLFLRILFHCTHDYEAIELTIRQLSWS